MTNLNAVEEGNLLLKVRQVGQPSFGRRSGFSSNARPGLVNVCPEVSRQH